MASWPTIAGALLGGDNGYSGDNLAYAKETFNIDCALESSVRELRTFFSAFALWQPSRPICGA